MKHMKSLLFVLVFDLIGLTSITTVLFAQQTEQVQTQQADYELEHKIEHAHEAWKYCKNHKHHTQQNQHGQQDSNLSSEIAESYMQAANSRSDTIDILHYNIDLDISDLPSDTIGGFCSIRIKAKMDGVEYMNLDLLDYTIKSVTVDGEDIEVFEYNSPLLTIPFPNDLNTDDEVEVVVEYEGKPQNSTWGGFYMTANHAYNMGVGIGVNPPNFGRAWFPCFDNFVERSTYEFHIRTALGDKAFCNGTLEDVTLGEDETQIWHWEMNQEIPTYLVAVAVDDYATLTYEYEGENGPIPVQYGVRPNDSTNLKNSFVNMPLALEGFEELFGPYQWDRIGFVIVPFSGGAMEHATNISYPKFGVNGGLTYESLMAHEFAHHWWGDLVTCRTADDMWINEGWASYSANLFFEYVYGKERFKDEVRSNHFSVVLNADKTDGGYHPVSGIPFEVTYSSTVYNKGADVAHTMRGYMGDSLFFHCTTAFLEAYSFQDVNSEEFRDYLTECSGIDMHDFFNDWVFSPGFSDFSIDSLVTASTTDTSYTIHTYVRQKGLATNGYHNNVPLELTFFDEDFSMITKRVMMSGGGNIFELKLPFEPVYAVIDLEERIGDATLDIYRWINTSGIYNYTDLALRLDVDTLTDSTWVRIEHHLVTPDRIQTPIKDLVISENHYWKIDVLKANEEAIFNSSVRFNYNGLNTTGGYIDRDLFSINNEDSLYLLYRPNAGHDWGILEEAVLDVQGNTANKRGRFDVPQLMSGEYAFAINDTGRIDTLETAIVEYILVEEPMDTMQEPMDTIPNMGLNDINDRRESTFYMAPNPAKDVVTLTFVNPNEVKLIEVFDNTGKLIITQKTNNSTMLKLNISDWENGIYFVRTQNSNGFGKVEKLLLVD